MRYLCCSSTCVYKRQGEPAHSTGTVKFISVTLGGGNGEFTAAIPDAVANPLTTERPTSVVVVSFGAITTARHTVAAVAHTCMTKAILSAAGVAGDTQ